VSEASAEQTRPGSERARSKSARGRHHVLPGFGLALGITLVYLTAIVVIPLAGLVLKMSAASWSHVWEAVASPRAVASYRLTIGAALAAAMVNAVFGLLVAWVLVRYRFPGKRIADAMIDLPFALPTAVAGIALTTVYSREGFLGRYFEAWGVPVAFTPIGIAVALTFVGLPFVVRTVEPVLQDLEVEVQEAAQTLGAPAWQIVRRIVLPTILPALLAGFTMAFARALGEYGSVVFISGNLPMKTEITTLLIMTKLEQYDYTGAAALAVVMLMFSVSLLMALNLLQTWSRRRPA
jgi:sulfate/thiosulfate transport system permease protein